MKARTSYAIYLLLAASAGAHSDIARGIRRIELLEQDQVRLPNVLLVFERVHLTSGSFP